MMRMGPGYCCRVVLLAGFLIAHSYGQGGAASVVSLDNMVESITSTAKPESLTEFVWQAEPEVSGGIVKNNKVYQETTPVGGPTAPAVTTAIAAATPTTTDPDVSVVSSITTTAASVTASVTDTTTLPSTTSAAGTTVTTSTAAPTSTATTPASTTVQAPVQQTTTTPPDVPTDPFPAGSDAARAEVRRLMLLEGYQQDIINQVLTSMPKLTPNQFKMAQTKVEEMRSQKAETTLPPPQPTHSQKPYYPPTRNPYKAPYVYPNYNAHPQTNYNQPVVNKYGGPVVAPTYPLGPNSAGNQKPYSPPMYPQNPWNPNPYNPPSSWPLQREQKSYPPRNTQPIPSTGGVPKIQPPPNNQPPSKTQPPQPAGQPKTNTWRMGRQNWQQQNTQNHVPGYYNQFPPKNTNQKSSPFTSIRAPASRTPAGVDPNAIRYLGGPTNPQTQPQTAAKYTNLNRNTNMFPGNRYQMRHRNQMSRQRQRPRPRPRPRPNPSAGVAFLAALQGGELPPSLLYAGLPAHIQQSPMAKMMLANPDMMADMAENPAGQAMIMGLFQ